jgi:transposase InsO family protein
VRRDFSRPGKPTDNAYIETFNGSLRDECLTCTGSRCWPGLAN